MNHKKLRELRTGQSMTQLQLAYKAGLTAITISMIERGATRNPDVATIRKLAGALGVKLEELL